MLPEDTDDVISTPTFRFTPKSDPCTAWAFSLPFKLLASLIVIACAAWIPQLWQNGALLPNGSERASATSLGWPLAALAMLVYTWWHIVVSRTSLSSQALHQSWIWDKHVEFNELTYCKLIRVPGLDWLIAPRLYVRTMLGKFAVFYVADGKLLSEFIRLIEELKAHGRIA